MTQHIKSETNRFMSQLETLKLCAATEQHATDTARLMYPGSDGTSNSNRALFMRVFRAPQADFQRALNQWKVEGYNFGKIAKLIPGRRPGGAPKGNQFAATHRKTSALPHCQSAWNAMSEIERVKFMAENGLMLADGRDL